MHERKMTYYFLIQPMEFCIQYDCDICNLKTNTTHNWPMVFVKMSKVELELPHKHLNLLIKKIHLVVFQNNNTTHCKALKTCLSTWFCLQFNY